MKKLIFLLLSTMLVCTIQAQVDSTKFWQISPRAGYDVWPNYQNNLQHVDYDGGIMFGASVDKYWDWFGLGIDFDYINNHSENTYPENDLYYTSALTNTFLGNVGVSESKIKRLFLGIGPNYKYQSKNNKFIAELNTRFGVSNIDGGYTILAAQDPGPPTSTIVLNEHAGYDGEHIFSYKGQLRGNYYFNDQFGVHLGAYYMNHTDASETTTATGIVERYYDVVNTPTGNEVQPLSLYVRGAACDCDIESIGLFTGVSIKLHKDKTHKCQHIPRCHAPCEPCCPAPCTTCKNYAVRINVENQVTGERIYNADIELIAEGEQKLSGVSNDNGGQNFENIKQKDYTAYAIVDGKKTTIATIDEEELVDGGVIIRTVYIGEEAPKVQKDITILVKDRPTGQLIANADVILKDASGAVIKTATTNSLGAVTFNQVDVQDYSSEGKVYDIATTTASIDDLEFSNTNTVTKTLYYEDLRFILKGKTIDTYTRISKPSVNVSLKNDISKNVKQTTSKGEGTFDFRLDKESSYTIQGQKRGEFSETEFVSTKGLVRSETLFVELELGLAVPTCDKSINLKNIYFDLDKFAILPLGAIELDRVYQLLVDNPSMRIEMSSHTDSRGSNEYNRTLSQNRANSTKSYLVNKGISPSRIVAVGYGETRLVNRCADGVQCSENEHQMNRRTEMKVICQ